MKRATVWLSSGLISIALIPLGVQFTKLQSFKKKLGRLEERVEAMASLQEENRQLRLMLNHPSVQKDMVSQMSEGRTKREAERERAEHTELMRLRGEVGVSRREIEELKTKLNNTAPSADSERPNRRFPFHPADTWANFGYEYPENAAITLLWALQNENELAYSGAFGRDLGGLEDAWSDAFKSVKGSFLSKPIPQSNGDVRISIAHETIDGDVVHTLVTYRQENGQWLIRSLAGFPTGILDTGSGTARHRPPVLQ